MPKRFCKLTPTDEEKIETLRLIGIVGDELATVTDAAALSDLDALSPVIPPLPLDILPASVKALLETTLGGTLSAATTVEVIVTGAKWKVRDEDNDVTYFLEEVTGGQLKISSEFQEFTLAAETYMLTIRGDLIFRFPAFESDGITPGPDLLVISGGASMKISRDGLEAFVLGRAKVGPTGSELLEFDAQGVLVINDSGNRRWIKSAVGCFQHPGNRLYRWVYHGVEHHGQWTTTSRHPDLVPGCTVADSSDDHGRSRR